MTPNLRALIRALTAFGLAAALMFPISAQAQDSGFGLGGVIGDPTGLSLKGYVGPSGSIDGAVGLGLLTEGHLSAYMDFLWERQLSTFDRANMALYFGVGPKIGMFFDSEDFRVGARAPVGLAFQFTERPLDVFVEIAAGLWFWEHTDFDLDLGVGARYWF